MYYTDTHIHLQDYKSHEVETVINSAEENGVLKFINASAHPSDWQKVADLADKYPQIIPAFGIHPWYFNQAPDNWEINLESLLQKYPHALVGECGIDRLKNQDTEKQMNILKKHIALAEKYGRTLILHTVKAENEFRQLLTTLPKSSVFHSFTSSAEWGREIQKHGFYLGFNFSILRKKNAAEILKNINLDHMLLETDGPYQNIIKEEETLPQNLPFLAEKISEITGITSEEFAQIIADNQNRFFGES